MATRALLAAGAGDVGDLIRVEQVDGAPPMPPPRHAVSNASSKGQDGVLSRSAAKSLHARPWLIAGWQEAAEARAVAAACSVTVAAAPGGSGTARPGKEGVAASTSSAARLLAWTRLQDTSNNDSSSAMGSLRAASQASLELHLQGSTAAAAAAAAATGVATSTVAGLMQTVERLHNVVTQHPAPPPPTLVEAVRQALNTVASLSELEASETSVGLVVEALQAGALQVAGAGLRALVRGGGGGGGDAAAAAAVALEGKCLHAARRVNSGVAAMRAAVQQATSGGDAKRCRAAAKQALKAGSGAGNSVAALAAAEATSAWLWRRVEALSGGGGAATAASKRDALCDSSLTHHAEASLDWRASTSGNHMAARSALRVAVGVVREK